MVHSVHIAGESDELVTPRPLMISTCMQHLKRRVS